MFHDSDEQPEKSRKGKGLKPLSFCDDLSEWKLAEEILLRENTLLGGMIDNRRDGVLIVSPTGKLLYFNRPFVKIWKFPEKLLETRSDEAALAWAAEQTACPEHFLARVAEVYADRFRPPMREELLMKDGRVFEHFGSAVLNEGTHFGWLWTFREVPPRKVGKKGTRKRGGD